MAEFLSALAALIAALIAWTVHRGQLYELARELHKDLTSGEVEAARYILGGRVRGVPNETNLSEAVRAYYRLLWCFERVYVGRRRVARARLAGATPLGRSPLDYLDELAGGHVMEWARRLEFLEQGLSKDLTAAGRPTIDNDESLPRMVSMVDAIRARQHRIEHRRIRLAKIQIGRR